MIKLTLNPASHPKSLFFNKDTLVIGSGPQADLNLTPFGEDVQPVHVKISQKNADFIITNEAFDPFLTLNGLPFGKKTLKNRDLIQIGKLSILFEMEASPSLAPNATATNKLSPLLDTEKGLNTFIEQVISSKKQDPQIPQRAHSNDLKELSPHEIAHLIDNELTEDEELLNFDIDTLIHELDNLEKKDAIQESPSPKALKPSPPSLGHKEFDDENTLWKENSENKVHESHSFFSNWKFLLKALGILLIISTLVAGVFFVRYSYQTEDEEMSAAEGVSDIAMALAYAQVHRIKPQKQNWSDPDFLRNNLNAVLTHDYPALANIDAHGHLNNTPYTLRIYTSNDFDHFLVIAQPAPSFLQWLIPKNAILIDSNSMELRKLQDIKPLNRLLVHADSLDGANAVELSHIISQGALLPLATLSAKKSDDGFLPPKALNLLRAGAENYVYNAPRYYQFGESLMKKAIFAAKSSNHAEEINRLKHEINALANFPHMVLYSSQGLEFATQAQKAIYAIVPSWKFLAAYIKFNAKGEPVSSHLIMDDDKTTLIAGENLQTSQVLAENGPSPKTQDTLENPALAELANHSQIMTEVVNNLSNEVTLQSKLLNLADERKGSLRPISLKLISLLRKHANSSVENFSNQLHTLITLHNEIDQTQAELIRKKLITLREEYNSIPLNQFKANVIQAGLLLYSPSEWKSESEDNNLIDNNQFKPSPIEVQLDKVIRATKISELDFQATQLAGLLAKDKEISEDKLLSYQTILKAEVMKKLDQLLTVSDTPSLAEELSPKTRLALIHVLKKVDVTDAKIVAAYLAKFDALADTGK